MDSKSIAARECALPQKRAHSVEISYYQPRIETKSSDDSGLVEETTNLELPYGHLEMTQWAFDGICINYSRNRYNNYFSFEKQNEHGPVTLGFNLRGSSVIGQHGKVYHVNSNQHNIIYANGFPNTFQNKALESETLMIEIQPEIFLRIVSDSNEVLKRFADNMLKAEPTVISPDSLIIHPELFKALQDIIQCRYTGRLKKIYLLSKSLEILVIQADAFNRATFPSKSILRGNADRERIIAARDYLCQNYSLPPSLIELARIVGINEYKLKKGFKEVFNTTVFGYLSDFRLEQARHQLHGEKSITEIAYELGYSSPQHFSFAFRKKFGVSPKAVKN